MKKVKRVIALLMALTLVFTLVACQSTNEKKTPQVSGEAAKSGDLGYKIGFSMPYAGTPYYEGITQAAKDRAAELGCELVVALANGDTSTQLADIETFISSGVDCAIIIPNDSSGCSRAFQALKEAEIPTVVIDRLPDDLSNVDVALACEDEFVGSGCGGPCCRHYNRYLAGVLDSICKDSGIHSYSCRYASL
jgi:putative xylitol transport system substrate-binding protein/inositol transport system substrate-binding protein